MTDNFLPPDYKPPESGGKYMKFKEGDNRFRILSKTPLIGYEGWAKPTAEKPNGHPIRRPKGEGWNLNDLKGEKPPRHFWAMAVWNYEAKQVQVLEITQAGIRDAIIRYTKDEDYGHPSGYDIVVTREGTDLNTNYTVTPKPPKKLDKAVETIWATVALTFDLSRLFANGDPFDPNAPGNGGSWESVDERNPPADDSDINF